MGSNAFDGIDQLLVDGNNLLHRVSGGVDPGQVRLLLARLSGVVPEAVGATLVLDGHAAPGTDRRQRVRRGLDILHSGSLTADEAMLNLIRDASSFARAGITIVSDDRALVEKARHLGARTQRLDWLEGILSGKPGKTQTHIGRRGIAPPAAAAETSPDRQPWKPGRGATRKRGNPRRGQH